MRGGGGGHLAHAPLGARRGELVTTPSCLVTTPLQEEAEEKIIKKVAPKAAGKAKAGGKAKAKK